MKFLNTLTFLLLIFKFNFRMGINTLTSTQNTPNHFLFVLNCLKMYMISESLSKIILYI